MSRSQLRGLVAVSAGLLLASLAGCKKKSEPTPTPAPPPAQKPAAAAPATPPLPDIQCPGSEAFAPVEPDKGRVRFVDCVVFAPGRYSLAGALSYEAKTGKAPKLSLLTGGVGPRITIFDVEPLPAEEITKLVRDSRGVAVKIRRTRGDAALVRLGVHGNVGKPEKPEMKEIGLLLQLVAHAPPKLLWVGEGDHTTVGDDGCLNEQLVDFELLFRTRLERFTTNVSRPAPGSPAKAGGCSTSSPSMQESVAYQALSLKKGRPLGEPADPGVARPAKSPNRN